MKIPRVKLSQNVVKPIERKISAKKIEKTVSETIQDSPKVTGLLPDAMKKSPTTGLTTAQLIDLILMNL